MFCGSKPGRAKKFFSSSKSSCRLCDPPSILLSGYWCSFPEVKRPGRDVGHLPSSRAISMLPPYAFLVWTVTSVFSSQLLNRLWHFPLLKNTDVKLELLGASLIHPTCVHVSTLIFLGSIMPLSSLLSLEFLCRLFPWDIWTKMV